MGPLILVILEAPTVPPLVAARGSHLHSPYQSGYVGMSGILVQGPVGFI